MLEPLSINESHYLDYTIASSNGYIVGLKSKINPLVIYYNKDTFTRLGLEAPSSEWDWSMLGDTIANLKEMAGENVYIIMSPAILEWVTMNRYGGRIVDTSGMLFSGYMDSDETVKAAEWLHWVGTEVENYKYRLVGSGRLYILADAL